MPLRRAVFLCLLPLVACKGGAPAPASSAAGGPPPALVELAQAQAGSVTHTWEALGEVTSLGRAELATGAAGEVEEVSVREGDHVRRGDALLAVNDRLVKASLAVAEAQVAELSAATALSTRELERLTAVKGDVLSPSELDRAKAETDQLAARLAAAEARVAEARETLRRHTVRAPFDGIITARRVDPGDWVQVGQGALDLVASGDLEVRVDVSPEIGRALKPGDAATVLGTTAVPARVVAVVPVLDSRSRTSLVRLKPDTPEGLTAGMAARVRLDVDISAEGAASVPRDALILGPMDTRITRAVDGVAQISTVEVIATSDTTALVRGVSPGDEVVIRGNERVRPGQALKVIGSDASAGEAAAHE